MEKKRNLWVIPTDKPSRLHYYNHIDLLGLSKEYLKWKQGRNIYITSDEEIKEGDWTVFISTNEITKVPLGGFKGKVCQKIILTTDQDLIKDGVQAIDDEFLQWFVKNSSCEYIKIENVYDKFLNGDKRSVSDFRKKYKINIPKEEPKQDWYCPKCDSYVSAESVTFEETHQICNTSVIDKEEPKQETLEEAGLKHCDILDKFPALVNPLFTFKEGAKWQQEQHKIDTDDAYLEGFENGKHWQQERMYSEEELQQKIDAHLEVAKDLWLSAIKEQKRMYSEEEVVNILIKAYEDIGKRKIPNQVVLASWFKQFKKK